MYSWLAVVEFISSLKLKECIRQWETKSLELCSTIFFPFKELFCQKYIQMLAFDVVFDFWQWESVERTCNRYCVCAHIFKNDEIIDVQRRQWNILTNLQENIIFIIIYMYTAPWLDINFTVFFPSVSFLNRIRCVKITWCLKKSKNQEEKKHTAFENNLKISIDLKSTQKHPTLRLLPSDRKEESESRRGREREKETETNCVNQTVSL